MYNHILYLVYWLVNFVVFYLFSIFFANNVVLGNWRYSAIEAGIYSAFWLTVLVWTGWDFIFSRGVSYKSGTITWIYFFILNTLGVWLIARFAFYLGLGISGWTWAIVIGFVATILQKWAWNFVTRRKLGVAT
jgi:hypothetical protein